jgi:hypothetical protein
MSNKNRMHDLIALIALVLLVGFLAATGKFTIPPNEIKALRQSAQ